jgi:glycosyltransferase involved in cell wall biosynthesis
MKIGYDAKYIWQDETYCGKSGYGVMGEEILRNIMKVDDENEYTVYLIEENSKLPGKPNFQFKTLSSPLNKSNLLRNIFPVPAELRRHPVDLFFTFTTTPWWVKCKIVLFISDIFWIAHPEWLPKKIVIPATIATRISLKRADQIITPTEFSKREIVRLMGVPEDKVTVSYHGIRPQYLEREDPQFIEQVKKEYGIEGNYILSINDIHPRKNMEGLVDAFCHLKEKEGIDHKLVLVGRSLWPYPSLFKKIEKSPFKKDIFLPGYIPSAHVRPLYQGASLFVYSSFYEGWGLQVHEAMCSGIPVAISNSSTLPEISGDAAVEFDPHDSQDMARAIFKVLDDPQLQKEMIRKGLEEVKKYSWEKCAREIVDVIGKVHG